MNPPTNMPKTFIVILSVKKLLTTLGEKFDAYIVRTTMMVEKVKVVIVRSEPDSVPRITFAKSTLVRNISGIYSRMGMNLISIKIATTANKKEIKIYLAKYNHILFSLYKNFSFVIIRSPFVCRILFG